MVAERDYITACPRTPEEIERLPSCPAIAVAAERRGISQIVHFTTKSDVVGILARRAVKSRARVSDDQYVEHVYKPNAPYRKDSEWLDYVNLSVERINDWMFQTSERRHMAGSSFWVVLSFHPQILTHPGVVFTTTNNIYPACERAEGLAGFCRMFANTVSGRYNQRHDRTEDQLAAWPTDRQAEVLYPGELSCAHLQRIDVRTEESLDTMHGILGGLKVSVPVRLAPEVFE